MNSIDALKVVETGWSFESLVHIHSFSHLLTLCGGGGELNTKEMQK